MKQMKTARRMARAAGLLLAIAGAGARADDVRVLDLPVRDIVYDPVSRRLYASVPGTAGSRANSITPIDPETGTLEKPVFVGSEPGRLVLGDGGKYVWVALTGTNAVRRYDIAAHKAGLTIALESNFKAGDLAPLPGHPESIIVVRQHGSDNEETVAIYDNGKPRSNTPHTGSSLAFGTLSGRLYAYETYSSSSRLMTLTPAPDGLEIAGAVSNLVRGTSTIRYANGLIYNDQGYVYDPEARSQIAYMPDVGGRDSPAFDIASGRLYYVTQRGYSAHLMAYDSRTFGLVDTLDVGQDIYDVGKLIRWGENGLALISGSKLILVRSSKLVPPPLPKVDLTVAATRLPATLAVGGTYSYTLTVANITDAPATGVYLVDRLSDNVKVVSAQASQGQATSIEGAIRADLGTIAPRERATVRVEIQIQSAASDSAGNNGGNGAAGGSANESVSGSDRNRSRRISHFAVVRGAEPDPAPDNNHDGQEIALDLNALPAAPTVFGIDLTGVWKHLEESSTGAGVELQATVSGTFEVRNIGDKTAPATKLRFFLAPTSALDALSTLLQEVAVPELGPGKTFVAELKAPLAQGDDAIGLYVIASVNATKTVDEVNKDNNLFPKQIP